MQAGHAESASESGRWLQAVYCYGTLWKKMARRKWSLQQRLHGNFVRSGGTSARGNWWARKNSQLCIKVLSKSDRLMMVKLKGKPLDTYICQFHNKKRKKYKGWVGLVGWPVADRLRTIMVTHQLQVKQRTGKVCWPETDILRLCYARITQ